VKAAPGLGECTVVDRLLWDDAQDMLTRHTALTGRGHCDNCGRTWPCPPRRLAERAQNAAFGSWNEAWTARHDLHSLRAVPGWRVTRNTGSFDPPTSHPR
jgi:hypothetical protein